MLYKVYLKNLPPLFKNKRTWSMKLNFIIKSWFQSRDDPFFSLYDFVFLFLLSDDLGTIEEPN